MFAVLKPPDRSTGWVLFASVLLPVADVQFGSTRFYQDVLAPLFGWDAHPLLEMHARLYQFAAVFVLFFVIPVLLWRCVLGRPLADCGMRPGDVRFGLRSLFAAAVLALPVLYASAGQADFQAEYPLSRIATQETARFIGYEAALLAYYIGWETLFRGFMLFGLRERYGDFGAILFQTFPSVLLHIGKPAAELWASVAAGLLFGAWVLRCGSIWYVLALHYWLGVWNDLFCFWSALR